MTDADMDAFVDRLDHYLAIGAGDTLAEAVEGNHLAEMARKAITEFRRRERDKQGARATAPKPPPPLRDPAYRAAVRQLPCLLVRVGGCSVPVEAAHLGDVGHRAIGRKADDRTCAPMCRAHHMDRDGYRGIFDGWSNELRMVWAEWAIGRTRKAVAAGEDAGVPW